MVFVNAETGKLSTATRWWTTRSSGASTSRPDTAANQVYEEGDAFPGTLNEDQQNIVTSPARPTLLQERVRP